MKCDGLLGLMTDRGKERRTVMRRRRSFPGNFSSKVFIHVSVDADGVCQLRFAGSRTDVDAPMNPVGFNIALATVRQLPSGKRMFDADTKVWSIDNTYWTDLREKFLLLTLTHELVEYPTEASFQAFLSGIPEEKVSWDGPENKAAADFFHHFDKVVTKVADTRTDKVVLATLLGVPSFDAIPSDKSAARSIYKKAALKLHPDRNNGDGSKMSELNRLWGAYVQPTL